MVKSFGIIFMGILGFFGVVEVIVRMVLRFIGVCFCDFWGRKVYFFVLVFFLLLMVFFVVYINFFWIVVFGIVFIIIMVVFGFNLNVEF